MFKPIRNALPQYDSIFLSSLFLFIWLFVGNVNAEGLSSLLNKESKVDSPSAEFLKVDEAFQFTSEPTDKGFKLSWKIAPYYYLYLERFKFNTSSPDTILGEPSFSTNGEPKEDPYFGLVHVIHDELEVFLPVTLTNGATEAEIKVSYQGCAEAGLCYPPKSQYLLFTPSINEAGFSESSDIQQPSTLDSLGPKPNSKTSTPSTNDLEDASSVFNFIQTSSLPLIIGIFFLLGLGLTFTPCVFPMIPIITSIIAGQEKPTTSKSLVLSCVYVLGMALTYAAAGVITGLLGAGANIQAALQDPYILSVFAGIFVLLSLAMFGLYELQLPAFIRDRLNTTSQNLNGGHITSVFLIGALSALVVSPCVSAPLAGALLYISSTADAVIGGASLFALGLGMGVPLIIIAVSGSKLLPKSGQWMNQVKYVFGIMLLAVAIWLLSRTLPGEVSMILWAILIGVSATQMGAFDSAKTGWPRVLKGFGLILALYSAILIVGALSGAHDPFKPLEKFQSNADALNSNNKLTNSAKIQFSVIHDMKGLEKERTKAINLGLPMMVDFYADWCISCIVMENQVFPLPEISQKLDQFHLVKADVTDNSDANQALLNAFGLFGPPSILFFDSSGNENTPLRVVGEIHKSAFEERLALGLVN